MEANLIPAHDRDAERAVLGACLRSNAAIDDLSQLLEPHDFYVFAHQKIFELMVNMHAEGLPVDAVTLADALNEKNLITDIGGHAYLVELYDASPSPRNAVFYADIVRDKAIRREIGRLSSEIQTNDLYHRGPAELFLSETLNKFTDLAERRVRRKLVSIAEASALALERLNERAASDGREAVLTGIDEFDRLTGGFGKGDLVILAARTSQGKTSVAVNFAYHVACKTEMPVLIFSLEQSRFEIGDKVNALRTGIDSSKFRRPKELTENEVQDLLVQTAPFFQGKPFYINDDGYQSIRLIGPIARQFKRQRGLRLMIVDYLQLLKSHHAGGWGHMQRHEQVAEVTRGLKALARELDCPVLALAQLNREVEGRPDKRPRLSDLRESGSIEQDADTVLLLQPPTEEEVREDPGKKNTLGIVIAKQRNGPTGSVVVLFDKATGRIENFSW